MASLGRPVISEYRACLKAIGSGAGTLLAVASAIGSTGPATLRTLRDLERLGLAHVGAEGGADWSDGKGAAEVWLSVAGSDSARTLIEPGAPS